MSEQTPFVTMDLSGVEAFMKEVIRAPGYCERNQTAACVERASEIGLVRWLPYCDAAMRIPPGFDVHYPCILGGRLCIVRCQASRDMGPTDPETGFANATSVWIVFGPRNCRYFKVDICIDPSQGIGGIWLRPSFTALGSAWFELWDKRYVSPSSDIMDMLCHTIECICDDESMRQTSFAGAILRYAFMSSILSAKSSSIPMPNLPLPKDRNIAWTRLLVEKAWSQSRLLADPFLTLRRKR